MPGVGRNLCCDRRPTLRSQRRTSDRAGGSSCSCRTEIAASQDQLCRNVGSAKGFARLASDPSACLEANSGSMFLFSRDDGRSGQSFVRSRAEIFRTNFISARILTGRFARTPFRVCGRRVSELCRRVRYCHSGATRRRYSNGCIRCCRPARYAQSRLGRSSCSKWRLRTIRRSAGSSSAFRCSCSIGIFLLGVARSQRSFSGR